MITPEVTPKPRNYARYTGKRLNYAQYEPRKPAGTPDFVDLEDEVGHRPTVDELLVQNPGKAKLTYGYDSQDLAALAEESPLPDFSMIELKAEICRESFYEFVKEHWDVVSAEDPVWNWHIEYLCNELQIIAERVFQGKPKLYDLIINISPGTTKSTIASVMFPAWCWTRMMSCRTISASYTEKLAMDLSRKSRDVLKSDKYKKMFPEIEFSEEQDAKSHFVNTKGGMRYAVGTSGSVTGMHGHFIIIDDPLDPNMALSEAELKTANHWILETLSNRKVSKSISVIILIMQRLAEHDPTGELLAKDKLRENRRIKHICLPAELTEDVSPKELAEKYTDGLMDPIRLSREALQEERERGEFYYAGQFLQTPTPRGGGMFKVEMLKTDTLPTMWKRLIRYWDKAGTQGGGAFTVGLKMGIDFQNRVWILDVIRGQWDSGRRERLMETTARNDGKKVLIGIEQEPGSGGKESAENSVRRLMGYRVTVNKVGKSDGDKEARADPLSAQVNMGNVFIAPGLWNDAFIQELRFFPMSRYKDQVDAASGAFNMVSKFRIRVGGL